MVQTVCTLGQDFHSRANHIFTGGKFPKIKFALIRRPQQRSWLDNGQSGAMRLGTWLKVAMKIFSRDLIRASGATLEARFLLIAAFRRRDNSLSC